MAVAWGGSGVFPGGGGGAGGSGTPGGSNTQVQYNSSGAFAGNSGLTFVVGTGTLSATQFSGGGDGLTGTASGLSIGGNAATADDGLTSATGTTPLNLSLVAKALTGSVDVMTGCDEANPGLTGTVPAPAAGNQANFLRGDGTWASASASPGGSDTQLQYNNGGSFGGALGTAVTAATGAIALTAQAATTTPLTIAGAAAQTAPHLRIEPVDAAVNAGVLRQSKQAQGAASKAGLGLSIYGDDAVAGSSSAGAAAGGSVTIQAGNAARYTSGDADGGDVKLYHGAKIGSGANGMVRVGLSDAAFTGVSVPSSGNVILGTPPSGRILLKAASTGGIYAVSTNSIGFCSGASFATGNESIDVLFRRKGAANPAWGVASGTPVAYTHSLAADSRSGTDTDVRGAKATLTPGIGTGTGGSGSFAVQTAVQGSTGTTANSTVDRQYVYSLAKALTDGSATGLFEVALPSGSHVGLTIEATVAAENASNYQTRRVAVQLAAHNKGGTVTASTPTEYGASELLDSGALTTTWTVTAGTGKITVNLNADSDLSTQTRLDVRYQLRIEGDTGTLVTEL